jgi:hypothetical protein
VNPRWDLDVPKSKNMDSFDTPEINNLVKGLGRANSRRSKKPHHLIFFLIQCNS